MSRETDSSPYPGEGGRGSGASYPSGTPPYGTGQQPKPQPQDRAPANQPPGSSEPAPDDPKTETTLTTRVRINIPGSRPIPPVVVRTTVNDDGEGGPAGPAPGEVQPSPVHGVVDPGNQGPSPVLPPGWEMPGASGQGPGNSAASGAPAAPAGPDSTGTGGQSRPSPTSDWFAPRKTGQQPVGPGAPDRDTSGQQRLPQQPPGPAAQQPPRAADRGGEPQPNVPYLGNQPRPGTGAGYPGGAQGPGPASGPAPGGPPPGRHQQPAPPVGGPTAGGGYPGQAPNPGARGPVPGGFPPGPDPAAPADRSAPGGFPGQNPGSPADRQAPGGFPGQNSGPPVGGSAPGGFPGQPPNPAGPPPGPGPAAGGPAPGGFAGERSAYQPPAPGGGGTYPTYSPPPGTGVGTGMPTGPTTGPATGPMTPPPPRRGEGTGAPQPPAGPGAGDYGPVGGEPPSSSDTLVSGIAAVPPKDPRLPSAPDPRLPSAPDPRVPSAPDPGERTDDGGEYRFSPDEGDGAPRGRSKLILAGVGLLGVVGIAYGAGLLLDHADVPRGTTVLGIDIGGKSTDDAVKTLDSRVNLRATVPLLVRIGSRNAQVDPRVAGLSIDTGATVRDVAHRDYNPVSVIGSLFGGERTAEAAVNIDEDKLRVALEDLAGKVDGKDRSEGMVKFVGGKPVGVPGTAGPGLDVDGAVSTVRAAYIERSETGQNKRVELKETQQQPKVDRAEIDRAIKEVGKPAMSGLVFVKAGGLEPLPFSPQTLSEVLTMVPAGDGKLQLHFDLKVLETKYGGYFDGLKVARGSGSATPVEAEDVARAMLPALRQTAQDKRVGEIPVAQ